MGDLERLRCYNDADHVRVRDAMLRLQQLHWSGSDAALLSFHRDGVMSALHCEGYEAGEHHEMDDIFGRPAYGIAQCCFSLALSTKCTCGCAIKLSEAQETNIMQLSMAHFGAKIAADNQSATKTLQRAFKPWIGRSNCKKCGQMELHQRRIVDHLPLTLVAGATICAQRAVTMEDFAAVPVTAKTVHGAPLVKQYHLIAFVEFIAEPEHYVAYTEESDDFVGPI